MGLGHNMKEQSDGEITEALKIILRKFDPLYETGENRDKYLPLYCYTATSSYALGLTHEERHKTVKTLRQLFDFFYTLTIEASGKYHNLWREYCQFNHDNHSSSAVLHHSKSCNFTEGKTFVCLGFPDGYYFDKNEPGQEFGEITYVIHGMYNFLKANTNYDCIFPDDELLIASNLYENIINNPDNKRVFLKLRLKKSDIAYVTQSIKEENKATEEKINQLIGRLLLLKTGQALALKDNYKIAEPFGNCRYKLCADIAEFKDYESERENALRYLGIIAQCIR